MTYQKADYPLDYTTGPKDTDRPQGAAEATRIEQVADGAGQLADKVAEQVRAYGEKAQEAARNFKPYVESSMKEQPMTTLAAAAVIGFALGALWKK